MFPSTTVNGYLHSEAVHYLFDHSSPCSRNDLSSSPFFHLSFDEGDGDGDGDAFLLHHRDFLQVDAPHLPHHHHHHPSSLIMPNATTTASAEAISSTTADVKLITEDISLMGPPQNFFPTRKKLSSSSLGRKRGSKKDRHSKIFTRQGPRDRRMRLSLEIARKFFNLQDMLGFDKASKTVDWLMTQSRPAIKHLSRDLPRANGTAKSSVSSASEGEVESGFDESPGNPNLDNRKVKAKEAALKAKGSSRSSRKAAFNPLSKEGRAIARARARERTKTKKLMNRRVEEEYSDQLPNPNSYDQYDHNQFTSLSPHETGDKKSSSAELLPDVEEPPSLSLDHQSSLHDTVDDSLSIFHQYHPQAGVNSISDDLISLQNNDMVINLLQENWDMDVGRPNLSYTIPNAHFSPANFQDLIGSPLFKMPTGNRFHPQFNDVQLYVRPWEVYNS